MSTLTLRGNVAGTGTFIVESPNSNTNRTLTLPDATGTLITADANGNVGIGVTPSAWGAASTAVQVGGGTTYSRYGFSTNTYYDGTSYRYIAGSVAATLYQQQGNGNHVWYVAPAGTAGDVVTLTPVMSLNSASQLFVNRTTPIAGASSMINLTHNGGTTFGVMLQNASTAASNALAFINSSGTSVGAVGVTTSATTYSTTSDYRLKENLQPIADASSRLAALNPVNFAWKADGSRTDGFIAHEAQAVVPQAVTGEKDAVDDEGNPVYQSIDHSKLVPLLTAALQEALIEIASLKARVSVLEAN